MYGMGCKNINWEKGKKKGGVPGRNRTVLLSLQVEVVSNDNMRLYLKECIIITPRGLISCKFVYIFIIKNKFTLHITLPSIYKV